jgi:hypothetical protein
VASGSAGGGAFRPAAQAGLALDGLEAAAGVTGTDAARTTASRVSRLLSPQPELTPTARATVQVGCVLLLALPTALLIVPGLLG